MRWIIPLCLATVACTPLASGDETLRDAARVARDGEALDAGQNEPDAAGDDADVQADASVPVCPAPGERETMRLERVELTEDARWSCQFDYEIDGHVIVSNGTLRIDPGVQVRADRGAFLLIGSGARLVAQGTAEQPIVFSPQQRPARPGAFRGLFMLGKADTALPNSATLGLPAGDARGFYGGADDEHDCGELRHVRIEFAGGPSDEYDFPAAALTLAGCGRKTRIESVQVHASTDGIGLVGGTVPLKRVLVSAPTADGIEWTAGYRGLVQFAVVQSFHGAGAALKGSGSLANPEALPRSAPEVFNTTLVGARMKGLPDGPSDPNGYETGVLLQGGTSIVLANSLLYGFVGSWLDVVGSETARLFPAQSQVESTIFADPAPRTSPGFPAGGIEPGDGEDDDGNFSEDAQLRDTNLDNRFFDGVFRLNDPFVPAPGRPDFSAEGFVDGGSLRDGAPAGWQAYWEPAFYAGALPKIQFESERDRDWTAAPAEAWTSFPSE